MVALTPRTAAGFGKIRRRTVGSDPRRVAEWIGHSVAALILISFAVAAIIA